MEDRKKTSNGNPKEDRAPIWLASDKLIQKVKDLRNNFGKPFAREIVKLSR